MEWSKRLSYLVVVVDLHPRLAPVARGRCTRHGVVWTEGNLVNQSGL